MGLYDDIHTSEKHAIMTKCLPEKTFHPVAFHCGPPSPRDNNPYPRCPFFSENMERKADPFLHQPAAIDSSKILPLLQPHGSGEPIFATFVHG